MEVEENASGEQTEEEKSEPSIISYHSEDFISKPIISDRGTVPANILEFHHSFGYDCRKRFNLCVADSNTLIFASGNLIHFLKVSENKLTFRRCSTGGGIGHITKNPKFEHIAIGENGENPPIIIYEWPSLDIVTVLYEGTTRSYSYLRYSPDGTELVSQGGDPDYLITVWDWRRSSIRLQCKSHGQDVYNVVFSEALPGHMTTCGAGHIKCWKMADTFTGLKLQGELGRFGKTEISDILAVYPMPDEKVISGCEWGNILVWNEGLIKIEVSRKSGKPCHSGFISQFEYIDGELVSVGSDGVIRVWYYETIDLAEPTEDSHFVEVEPVYELVVPETMLMQMLRKRPDDPKDTRWYAQDGNGGIWLLDLPMSGSPSPSKRLLKSHAGPIADMDVADWGPYVSTIGTDGCLHIYQFLKKKLILTHRFRDPGCCVEWLASSVEPSGSTLICAFESGVVRMVSVNIKDKSTQDATDENVKLTKVLKPHSKKIVRMSVNPSNSLLVTASEDLTIFVFQIKIQDAYPDLVPIGYIEVPSTVSCMTWKPASPITIFMGCARGQCVQVNLPEEPQDYTDISYKLVQCEPIEFSFKSVKSFILREQIRLENERDRMQRIAVRREELAKLKESNPGIEIDEEAFLEADLGDEAALPEIYVPEVPNPVLTAYYTTRDTVLISMGGFDAGYTYEYSIPEIGKETIHVNSSIIADCDEEIRSYLFYNKRKYIVFGMERGEIRVCKINPEDETDFSNYWILPMHDNFLGCIPTMKFSYDKKVLLTCGHDGNIFSFLVHDDKPAPEVRRSVTKASPQIPDVEVTDIEESDRPTLEEVIVKAEQDRIMVNAKAEKERTLKILSELAERYDAIVKKNNALPPSQRLTEAELELDPRITEDLNEKLKAEMDLVYKKFAHTEEKSKIRLKKLMDHFIEPITCLPFAVRRILKSDTMVHSLRELKLTGDFDVDQDSPSLLLDELYGAKSSDSKLKKNGSIADSMRTTEEDEESDDDDDDVEGGKLRATESFLRGLSPRTIQYHLGDEINQLLKKYRSLKAKLEEQDREWKILQSEKPDPNAINPDDEEAIEYAKNTIGDYKLKVSLSLDGDAESRPTVISKYKQIIQCRRQIHFRREGYNDKLRALREKKVNLQKEVDELIMKLKKIQLEMPHEWSKDVPQPVTIDQDLEFPERNLEMKMYTKMEERMMKMKKRKQSSMIDTATRDFDDEYEVLLLDETRFRPRKSSLIDEVKSKYSDSTRMVRIDVPQEILDKFEEAEKVDTKLEREMKRFRVAKKKHEQDQIINHIERSYKNFDEELDQLEMERFDIVYESVYMDLFLLTLHQELIVLKRFEGMENELSKKVKSQLKTKTSFQNKIQRLMTKVEEKHHHVTKLQEKIKDHMSKFISTISDDKFYIFLKRICKKKFKPKTQDGSSSESSSSESDDSSDDESDDDGGSEDSRRREAQTQMHLDESICPEGCNRELYEEAFIVRDKRYDMEQRIREDQRSLETMHKQLDQMRKNLNEVETELSQQREKLDAFLREKQRQLNDIDVTVILKLSQLQCFTKDEKVEKIQDCILFDKTKLSQLYSRVGELQQETAEIQERYKKDKQHLRRMKADCEAMKNELETVKRSIKKEMQQKFGQQVSLVSLYEAVLRRLVHGIKANTGSLMKFYDDKIGCVKTEYRRQMRLLKDLIQENTEKLSFLTVLEEELFKLRKNLNRKLMSEEEIEKIESQYKIDLCKLRAMLKDQEEQKAVIAKDIDDIRKLGQTSAQLEQKKKKALLDHCDPKEKKRDNLTAKETVKPSADDDKCEKKIAAIRNLLAEIVAADETNTKETIEIMLREITEKLERSGYCREEIERNIRDIMRISSLREGSASSRDTIESLSDTIYQYGVELRKMKSDQGIHQESRSILNDIFLSLGIQDRDDRIAQELSYKLRTTGSTQSATTLLLQKLPPDTDSDTKEALSQHITPMIMKLKGVVEVPETEEELKSIELNL